MSQSLPLLMIMYIIYYFIYISVDRQIDRQIYGWMNGWMDGWMDGQMDGWIDRQIDGQIDRQIDRQIDKQIDRQIQTTYKLGCYYQIANKYIHCQKKFWSNVCELFLLKTNQSTGLHLCFLVFPGLLLKLLNTRKR